MCCGQLIQNSKREDITILIQTGPSIGAGCRVISDVAADGFGITSRDVADFNEWDILCTRTFPGVNKWETPIQIKIVAIEALPLFES